MRSVSPLSFPATPSWWRTGSAPSPSAVRWPPMSSVRSALFALTLGPLALGASGCVATTCTTDARSSVVTVYRFVPASEIPVGATVTACVDGSCKDGRVDEGGAVVDAQELFTGEAEKVDGKVRITVRLVLSERTGTTVIAVRARSLAGDPLLDVTGDIAWRSDGCHSEADKTFL